MVQKLPGYVCFLLFQLDDVTLVRLKGMKLAGVLIEDAILIRIFLEKELGQAMQLRLIRFNAS
jgi:hypothetical protein